MHAGLGDDDEFAARFVREARAAARLSHPNVVAVFDQGDDDGTLFLAMEYVPGHTLRDLIRKESADVAGQGARAARAGALRARRRAPRPGMIHRDVKPENVLIADDRPGQGRRLRAGPGGQRRDPAHRDRRRADRHRLLPRPRARRRRPRRRPLRRVRRRAWCSTRCSPAASRTRASPRSRSPTSTSTRTSRRRRGWSPASRRTSTRWSPAPPPATASLRPGRRAGAAAPGAPGRAPRSTTASSTTPS